jgi:hypothetical protein
MFWVFVVTPVDGVMVPKSIAVGTVKERAGEIVAEMSTELPIASES